VPNVIHITRAVIKFTRYSTPHLIGCLYFDTNPRVNFIFRSTDIWSSCVVLYGRCSTISSASACTSPRTHAVTWQPGCYTASAQQLDRLHWPSVDLGPLKQGDWDQQLVLTTRKRRPCRPTESCPTGTFRLPWLRLFPCFFPQLQGKCRGIRGKDGARPVLFAGKTDKFHNDVV
jgi:hypothetical protein